MSLDGIKMACFYRKKQCFCSLLIAMKNAQIYFFMTKYLQLNNNLKNYVIILNALHSKITTGIVQ